MNPRAIHESLIVDIIDGMSDFTDPIAGKVRDNLDKADKKRKNAYNRDANIATSNSIARASKGLVFTYPVLCSSSIDIKKAMSVAKALERRNVTMLQMLLAANQLTKSDISDYIKDFHTNLDYDKMNLDDVMDILTDTRPFSEMVNMPCALMDMMPLKEKANCLNDFRSNTNYFFKDDINENSISNYKVMDRNGYYTIIESKQGEKGNPKSNSSSKSSSNPSTKPNPTSDSKSNTNPSTKSKSNSTLKQDTKPKPTGNSTPKPTNNTPDPSISSKSGSSSSNGSSKDIRMDVNGNDLTYIDGSDRISKMTAPDIDRDRLISTEVKKANEIVPTLMLINTINPDNGVVNQAVIGVKSRLIKVPSREVISRIIAHYQDSNTMLKFVKLTTREISFIKDFLLAIDNAKLDALNRSKRGSSTAIFNALERRAEGGKVRRLAKSDKQYAKAITSLVISKEDAEDLIKYHNIDVESIRVIKPIMERLNLLYFVIVDESSESVKILIDGADEYEEYPFDALDKESKDDSYKKVINLMTKMTR